MDRSTERATDVQLIREIVYTVFKRKAVLIALVVAGLALAVYGLTTTVPMYKATSTVLVRQRPASYRMPIESGAVLEREDLINTEVGIFTSAAVAGAVVDDLGLAEGKDRVGVVERLQRMIKVKPQAGASIIDVTYRHGDAETAAEVVNSAVDAYLQVRKSIEVTDAAVAYLDKQTAIVEARIDSIGAILAHYRGAQGSLHENRLGSHQMDLIQRIRYEIQELEVAVNSREEQLAMVEDWLDSGGDLSHVPSGDIYDMATVVQAKAKLVEFGTRLATAEARYAPGHPEIGRLRREGAALERLIRSEVEQALLRQQMRLEEWKAKLNASRDVLEYLHSTDADIASERVRIRILESEFETQLNLRRTIVQRRDQFRVTAATDPDLLNVAVLAWAMVPTEPDVEPVNMRVAVGLLTIVFGVMLILGIEKLDHTLQRRDDTELHLGVKVLASIPERER